MANGLQQIGYFIGLLFNLPNLQIVLTFLKIKQLFYFS